MNRRFFFTLFFVGALAACSKSDKAIVKVNIDGGKGKKLYLIEQRTRADHVEDSNRIGMSGRETFRIDLQAPAFYILQLENGAESSIILSPGDEVKITADYKNYHETKTIEGSLATKRINILYDSLRNASLQLEALRIQYDSVLGVGTNSDSLLKVIEVLYAGIQKNHHRYSVKFILEDLTSLANLPALYQQYAPNEYVFSNQRDLQFFKLVSDSLLHYYPNVRIVKQLKDDSRAMISEYQHKKLMQAKKPVERDIPELVLPNTQGSPVALSDLKGKLVLVSFWTPENKESIANVIQLKNIYKKHKPQGFEIYQVAFDQSLVRWKTAVNFEEISWVSVCDTAYERSATRSLFNVTSIPMNYLISRDQTEIIAKNVSPEALNRNLPQLLKD